MADHCIFTGAAWAAWSNDGNWNPNAPVAGDTWEIPWDKSAEVDMDGSGTDLLSGAIDGSVRFKANANTALQVTQTITISNTGELIMGNSGSPVGAAYTSQLIWNGADGGELLQINAGGKLTTNGAATYNLQSEAWASCTTTLQAQAASGQADISVPAAFANALQASGDILVIQGTTSYTQCEIVVVDSKSGGTITLTGNLANTHASGAYVFILSRNVIIKGTDGSHRFKIDNDNTAAGNVDCKLTFFENCYQLEGLSTTPTWECDFCTWKARYAFYACKFKLTNCVAAGENTSARLLYLAYAPILQDVALVHGQYGLHSYAIAQSSGLIVSGFLYGVTSVAAMDVDGIEMSYCWIALYPTGVVRIANGNLHDNSVSDINLISGEINLRYCTFDSVGVSSGYGGYVYLHSQDHGQVIGAAKTWVGQIGTIERQNSVARSGYAAECTPDTQCSSDEPLPIKWDIPCTHGDVITATVYARVNATYGTANDPSFILDPDSLYGCNDTASENISAADTWTQLSVTGTANLGGAGVKGVVNVVLRIPYYTSGGKVYVDDFEVTIA